MNKNTDMKIKRVILALDGMDLTLAELVLDTLFQSKESIATQMIAMIKLNDMAHGHSVGELKNLFEHVPQGIEFFLDLKLADVSTTCGNIAKRYVSLHPAIITVRENIDCQSLISIHEALPNTLITLVSALTDISETDFVDCYGMVPREYIAKHLEKFQRYLGVDNPLGACVCSPLEVTWLKERFPHLQFITPGVRDVWMAADHQKRIMGIVDTLRAGADLVVMGVQMLKGNPAKGIFAEISRQLTFETLVSLRIYP